MKREGFEPLVVLLLRMLSKRADKKRRIGFLGKIKSENLYAGCVRRPYMSSKM